MTPLNIGDLRHQIVVRRLTEQPDGAGGYESSWADHATMWAEVRGLDGRESVMDHVLEGISVFRVRCRYRDDLLYTDQLRSSSGCFGFKEDGSPRDVNIRSLVDPDGRREQLVIMADTASARS